MRLNDWVVRHPKRFLLALLVVFCWAFVATIGLLRGWGLPFTVHATPPDGAPPVAAPSRAAPGAATEGTPPDPDKASPSASGSSPKAADLPAQPPSAAATPQPPPPIASGPPISAKVTREIEEQAKRCQKGESEGCFNQGFQYWALGLDHDDPTLFTRAFALIRQACDMKLRDGCDMLARLYAEGQGTPRDLARAIELRVDLCSAGPREYCGDLGKLLADDRQAEAAVNALQKGCSAGDQMACRTLSEIYESGDLVGRDLESAAAWRDAACVLGEKVSCSWLAAFYANGNGGASNIGRAPSLRKRACELGDEPSCVPRP